MDGYKTPLYTLALDYNNNNIDSFTSQKLKTFLNCQKKMKDNI